MNYVPADNGEMVIAEGAPGSIARVRVQFPCLIEKLRKLKRENRPVQDAEFLMQCNGINSRLERNSLLTVASYPPETHPLDMEQSLWLQTL